MTGIDALEDAEKLGVGEKCRFVLPPFVVSAYRVNWRTPWNT
jgi:hypothetical protein